VQWAAQNTLAESRASQPGEFRFATIIPLFVAQIRPAGCDEFITAIIFGRIAIVHGQTCSHRRSRLGVSETQKFLLRTGVKQRLPTVGGE
jgi:hypothetical protein